MNSLSAIDPRGTTRQIASAMQGLERRFEVVADNLANLETSGHKRLVAFSHGSSDEGGATQGASSNGKSADLHRDFSQGDLVETGDPGDLALKGEGFLAVEVEDQTRFVRAVHLLRDAEGTLIDSNGARLLGESGPIRVPTDAQRIDVAPDGTVSVDRDPVGKLRIVTFVDPQQLVATGAGRFAAPEGAEVVAAAGTDVAQGFRERSNTEPVRELVELIVVQRQYEAAQRALSTESELRQRLNDLSR